MQILRAEHKATPPVVAEYVLEAPFYSRIDDPFNGESIRCYQIDLPPVHSQAR